LWCDKEAIKGHSKVRGEVMGIFSLLPPPFVQGKKHKEIPFSMAAVGLK